jgi:glutamine---fructose-6-phosphate transaminase (isomerizing)
VSAKFGESARTTSRAPDGTRMFAEAAEAADAVARQFARNADTVRVLAARLRRAPPAFIATCARGSSDHAATFAKYVLETRLGIVTASLSPSVHSVYAAPLRLRGALFVAISQSGRSPDLLRNAEAARDAGAHVLALVNAEDAPLAALADTVLPLCAGDERSVAATKSCLASLAAVLQFAAAWSEDAALHDALTRLPDALRAAWRCDWSPLVEGLADARSPAVNSLFVLGRGPGLGAAQEAALKFKETCGLHAEAYSSAEVKHGPMALVGPGFPVLAFVPDDDAAEGTRAIAREFRARGARVWEATHRGDVTADALALPPSPHPLCTPLLTVQAFYRAANALSLRRGFDPDVPPHLAKVTETL